MKINYRVFGILALFAALVFTGALVVGHSGVAYGYGGEKAGQAAITTGSFVGMDEPNQLFVKTTVPGIFGPENKILPYKIDNNSTMTICFKSIKQCDSGLVGQEGWSRLRNLEERSDFSLAPKEVKVVHGQGTNDAVHVEVDYDL